MVTIILPKLPHTHTHCLSACVHCYPLTCNGPVLGVHWTSSETWSSQKQSPQWLWDWSTDRLASSKSHGSETPGKPSLTRREMAGKKQSFLFNPTAVSTFSGQRLKERITNPSSSSTCIVSTKNSPTLIIPESGQYL